jgi:hypothetical protein
MTFAGAFHGILVVSLSSSHRIVCGERAVLHDHSAVVVEDCSAETRASTAIGVTRAAAECATAPRIVGGDTSASAEAAVTPVAVRYLALTSGCTTTTSKPSAASVITADVPAIASTASTASKISVAAVTSFETHDRVAGRSCSSTPTSTARAWCIAPIIIDDPAVGTALKTTHGT